MQPTKTQDEDITDKSGIITHWHKIKYYRKNANTTTNVEHVHCERENKTAKSVHPFGQTATLPFAMKQMHGSVMFSEIHPNIGTDISLISFLKKKYTLPTFTEINGACNNHIIKIMGRVNLKNRQTLVFHRCHTWRRFWAAPHPQIKWTTSWPRTKVLTGFQLTTS